MHVLVVNAVDLVETGPGGYIDFTADDGLDPGGLGGFVEVDNAVHDPVVRDGHGALPQLLYTVHQLPDKAGAVQETEFSMEV